MRGHPLRNDMRIAHIGLRGIGEAVSGGVERHVRELAVRMAARGHSVSVICRSRYETHQGDDYQGVALVRRPAVYTKHLEAITNTAAGMPAAIGRADLVHIHATGPSLLSALPRLAGRAAVVTVHGLDFQRAKWGGLASMILRAGAWTAAACPNRTIVVSAALRDHYAARGHETVHIPNGVPEATRRPLDALSRFGLMPDRYVLALGRMVPEKGFHHLVRAYRGLKADIPLVLAGPASHSRDYLRKLRELAGDDPRILFTGALFGADKDEALSNARLLVLPSDLEGMPLVLLEAMAYGCPVLTSDIAPCLETLDDGTPDPLSGRLGWSFPAGDVQALADSLARLLPREDLRPAGERARTLALSRYDWEGITDQTLDVYRSALGSL